MPNVIDKKPIDKWIPWLVVLFFLSFMTVDAIMVTLAIRTQTGVVTEKAYEKGLAYNQALEASTNQESWGWQHHLSLDKHHLTFTLKDKNEQFIDHADVKAKIIRPIQDGDDFEIKLNATQNSTYEAEIPFPMPGQWTIRVYATWMDKQYQVSQNFLVQ